MAAPVWATSPEANVRDDVRIQRDALTRALDAFDAGDVRGALAIVREADAWLRHVLAEAEALGWREGEAA